MKQFYKQRVSILLCMLMVLTLIVNWEGENTNIPGLTPFNAAKELPDFYLTNVTTRQYDNDGELSYLMNAENAEHQPANNTTKLDKPRIIIFSEDDPWHLTSEEGVMVKNGQLLILENNVFLYKDLRERDVEASKSIQIKTLLGQSIDKASMQQNNESIKVNTRAIAIHTGKRTAITSEDVVIRSPEGVTTAKGLGVDMNKGTSVLFKDVQGVYNAL